MIEKKLAEQTPSMGQQRAARAMKQPGVSATRLQRSDDIVSKRGDTASKDVAGQLKVYNFALSKDFSKSAQFAQMIELATKEMQANIGKGNPQPDMTAMMQSAEFDDDSMLESKLEALKEFTSVQSIDNNLLLLMMGGDPVLTQQARIALKQIENDRGVNKRFMPALRKLLSHLTDILADAGMAGYKVIDNLHSTMSPEKHQINKDIKAGGDDTVDLDYEPSDEEISKYGIDNNIPTVTADQKKNVTDILKAKKADSDDNENGIQIFGKKDGNKDDEEKQKMAASKYSEEIEELKSLAGLSEAMSDVYGSTVSEESEERVTYTKTKKDGDATVTVSANADSMEELHKVLKLAGITLPDSDKKDQEDDHEGHDEIEKDHVEDGEKCDCCGNEVVDGECGCGPECPHCGGKPGEEPEDKNVMVVSPQDASMSTDKEVLVNFLKDKLKKSIS